MVLGLILLNGIFAGAEIAVISLRKTRLQELLEAGSRSARWVAQLRRDPEQFLATVQVGITVVSATAAAFGGSSVAVRLAPLLEPLVGHRADQVALALVVAGVSYLSLVLGELVPKSLALRAAEPYALFIARPLALLAQVARPLVWVLTVSSNAVLKLFGDRTSFAEGRLSPDELQQLVDEAAATGVVDPGVGEIASRALELAELDAAAVMVPHSEVVSVPITASLDQIAELTLETGHNRLLVYKADPDDVVGFVNVREVLARGRQDPTLTLEDALHTVPFVPTTAPVPALLRDLQRQRTPIAVVVDEQGTVRGLVTVKDLVEELVGDMLSEHDFPDGSIRREPDGSVVVDASTPVHAVNRDLDLSLPEGENFKTVGGLVMTLAGRIPARGDRIRADGHEIEVLDATRRKVKTVRIVTPP